MWSKTFRFSRPHQESARMRLRLLKKVVFEQMALGVHSASETLLYHYRALSHVPSAPPERTDVPELRSQPSAGQFSASSRSLSFWLDERLRRCGFVPPKGIDQQAQTRRCSQTSRCSHQFFHLHGTMKPALIKYRFAERVTTAEGLLPVQEPLIRILMQAPDSSVTRAGIPYRPRAG